MKLSSLLASSSLLALVACTSSNSDGRWSDADREHLFRAFEAASGVDASKATLDAIAYSEEPVTTACPKVAHAGSLTTVTGGCSVNGLAYEGSFTAENVPQDGNGTGYDASKPTVIHFDAFTIDLPYPTVYDGEIDLTGNTIASNLDVTFNGVLVHSDLTLASSGASYTAMEGSSIDVDGFGPADVSGTWAFDPGAGSITLDAAQKLVIDLSTETEDGCYAASIDGGTGTWACLK